MTTHRDHDYGMRNALCRSSRKQRECAIEVNDSEDVLNYRRSRYLHFNNEV
jgi:hypothetical protein